MATNVELTAQGMANLLFKVLVREGVSDEDFGKAVAAVRRMPPYFIKDWQAHFSAPKAPDIDPIPGDKGQKKKKKAE